MRRPRAGRVIALLLLGVLVMTVARELLIIAWHEARERRRAVAGAALAAALEVMQWLPLWLALESHEPLIIVAAVVAAGGTSLAVLRRLAPP